MIENSEPEITDEVYAAKEREIAALFCTLQADAAMNEAGSAARQARIMSRVQTGSPQGEGQARIGRILDRIQSEHPARKSELEATQG
jgi:hypothetical protein